jgi:hypothetical protein
MESHAADQLEGGLASVPTKLEGNPSLSSPVNSIFMVGAATICDCVVADTMHPGCF